MAFYPQNNFQGVYHDEHAQNNAFQRSQEHFQYGTNHGQVFHYNRTPDKLGNAVIDNYHRSAQGHAGFHYDPNNVTAISNSVTQIGVTQNNHHNNFVAHAQAQAAQAQVDAAQVVAAYSAGNFVQGPPQSCQSNIVNDINVQNALIGGPGSCSFVGAVNAAGPTVNTVATQNHNHNVQVGTNAAQTAAQAQVHDNNCGTNGATVNTASGMHNGNQLYNNNANHNDSEVNSISTHNNYSNQAAQQHAVNMINNNMNNMNTSVTVAAAQAAATNSLNNVNQCNPGNAINNHMNNGQAIAAQCGGPGIGSAGQGPGAQQTLNHSGNPFQSACHLYGTSVTDSHTIYPNWNTEAPNSPPGLVSAFRGGSMASPWCRVTSPDEVSTVYDSHYTSLLSSPDSTYTLSSSDNRGALTTPVLAHQVGSGTVALHQVSPGTNAATAAAVTFGQVTQNTPNLSSGGFYTISNTNNQHGMTPDIQNDKNKNTLMAAQNLNQQQQQRRGKIVTAASNGQLYKTKLCYYHVHGTCSWGESCHHAHSLEELMPKPDLSKTSICPKLGECKRKNCPFAHSREELRSTECFAKTKVCFGSCENCRFGGNCRYAHSISELKRVKDLPTKVMANIKGKRKAPPLQSLKEGDAKRGIKLIHSRAKGDFDASSYGEGYIDLYAMDRVAIVKDDDDGWMYGKNFTQNSIGWFPTSYVTGEFEDLELEPICPQVQ